MLDMEKLFAQIKTFFSSLTVNSSLCPKIKSHLSKCNHCVQVCPANCISFSETAINIGNCIECGLCTGVCPTGALAWQRPSPFALITRIKDLAGKGQEAIMGCLRHSNAKRDATMIRLPCLGILPWECWLEILLLPKAKIYLPEPGCLDCCLKDGEVIWHRELYRAQAAVKKEISVITQPTKLTSLNGRKKEVNNERREFLAALVGGAQKVPGEIIAGLLSGAHNNGEYKEGPSLTGPAPKVSSQRRRSLISLLQENPELAGQFSVSLPASGEKCNFCHACSILCPEGALRQVGQDDQAKIELNPAACSGCSLCADICFSQAIIMKESSAAALFERDQVLIT